MKITKNIQDQSPFQRTFSSGISHWHFTSIYIRYIKHCRACLLTLKNYFLLYFGTVPPIVVFTSPILLYWTRSSYDLPLYYNYSCNKNCLTKIRGHFYNSSVVGGGGHFCTIRFHTSLFTIISSSQMSRATFSYWHKISRK